MINVTKTYLPAFDDYTAILKRAWDNAWITNNGELVQELEAKLKAYLDVKNLLFTGNGTIVLQMALKALNITKAVITTPFSYVATTNAIIWERCIPVFADIDPQTFCIDPAKIEEKITSDTQAILATHVYGMPCDIEAIEAIAGKHGLKVIYDAAHAFGTVYKGRSLLSYGDISTCSFHATKIFHTVEGGCIIANNEAVAHQLMLYRQFGHVYDDYFSVGINGKNSEFHAAMGLCVLPELDRIMEERRQVSAIYDNRLGSGFQTLQPSADLQYNYAYYPVVFDNESRLEAAVLALEKAGVKGRRYFFPSLNTLPYLPYASCPVSEDISRRVYCLPLYFGLSQAEAIRIAETIQNV